MPVITRRLLTGLALSTLLAPAASAQTAARAASEERVILSIDGAIKAGGSVDFTRADLERLGLSTLSTTTPWHDGPQTFEGVQLEVLLDKVGAQGKTLHVVALNKYRTEVPVSDFAKYKPILAMKRNGAPMEIRDKGPLFIIYPFDSHPELKSELYYGRAVWQVRAITVQ